MCESFFATLECELLAPNRFKTPAEARSAAFDFIEGSARGRTEECLDTGGQHAVKSHRLIPNAQQSTKPG
jgi:hypothetical protein